MWSIIMCVCVVGGKGLEGTVRDRGKLAGTKRETRRD